MVHFIRDKKNNIILDLEVFTNDMGVIDLRSVVNIEYYSRFLLEQDTIANKEKVIFVMGQLSEARGWYWEVYKATINKNPTVAEVEKVIGQMVRQGAESLGLNYVTD